MKVRRLASTVLALATTWSSPALAQEDAAEVLASNSQSFVDDLLFDVPTNAASFTGVSVSPGGWVFFTMGVRGQDMGYGDALFASNGGLTQVLLGPDELGAERRIPQTLELLQDPKLRATDRDTVLIRATVGGTDGLWEVSPAKGTLEQVAAEGEGELSSVGMALGGPADQFWGDDRGLVHFVAARSFIPTIYAFDGATLTPLLSEDSTAAGGTVVQLKHVGIDAEGRVYAVTPLVVDTGNGLLQIETVLRHTPGTGTSWELMGGDADTSAGDIAAATSDIHVGRGGHVAFRGSYYSEENPPGSGFWNTREALMRVSPDGQVEVLADLQDTSIGFVDDVHVTPTGAVYAAVRLFDNADAVLHAPPGGALETLFTASTPGPFGTGTFVRAYEVASDDAGNVYVSGESTTGQVVVRLDDPAPFELLSDQFTYTVDGEARVAEDLYFDDGGPFASSDGAVVCARIDLDNPTDVGVVCVGEATPDASLKAEVVDHELVRVTESLDHYAPEIERYEYWVDVDLEAGPGFWQVDLDIDADPPMSSEVRLLNRVDGSEVSACSVSSDLVRCGEVVATDDVALQLRLVLTPTAPTQHDLTLTLRGSNDGPEVELAKLEHTLTALEQQLVPIEDGTACYYRAVATEGAGQPAFFNYYGADPARAGQVLDVPSTAIPTRDQRNGTLMFDTSEEGVRVQAPQGRYSVTLRPVMGESVPCLPDPERASCSARMAANYDLDPFDDEGRGNCRRTADGTYEEGRCATGPAAASGWMALLLGMLTRRRG